MNYSREDYLSDCRNPDMPHIKDYGRYCAFYEELGNDPVQKKQQVVPHRIDFIEPRGSVIELGCHVGFNSILWAQQGLSCIGVDFSSTLIEEANRRRDEQSKDTKDRLRFICADILDLSTEELGLFDTVVLTEVLEHVPDPLPILEKAVEFMHGQSKLYVSAPDRRVGTYAHVRGISEQYLIDTANELSLDIQIVPDKSKNTKYRDTRAILELRD